MKQISLSRLIITIISSCVIIALMLYLTILYFNFFPKGEDIHVYLPQNYDKNYIIIFYDQKDGRAKERINGDRLFKVPASGILFTQYNMQREWVKYKYFYVNDKGIILQEIKYNDYSKELQPNKVYVMQSFSTFKEIEGYESKHIIIGKSNIIGKNNSLTPLSKTRKVLDSIVEIKYSGLSKPALRSVH